LIKVSKLVNSFIDECKNCGGDEVVLETEVVNIAALKLYESILY
jgi:ribosomal protein S18 acetylase RimI-like enzyme